MGLEDILDRSLVTGLAAGGLTASGIELGAYLLSQPNIFVESSLPLEAHFATAAAGLGMGWFARATAKGKAVADHYGIIAHDPSEKRRFCIDMDAGTAGAAMAVGASIIFNKVMYGFFESAGYNQKSAEIISTFESFWKGTAPVIPLAAGLLTWMGVKLAGMVYRTGAQWPTIIKEYMRKGVTGRVDPTALMGYEKETGIGWTVTFAKEAMRQGNYGVALRYVEKAMRSETIADGFSKDILLVELEEIEKKTGPGPDRLIQMGLVANLLGDTEAASRLLKSAADEHQSLAADITCAKYFKLIRQGKISREYLASAADKMIADDSFLLTQRTESTNKVLFVDNEHFDDLVIFKQSSEDGEVARELKYIFNAQSVMAGRDIAFPSFVGEARIDEGAFGVWELIKARTLFDIMQEQGRLAFELTRKVAFETGYLLGGLATFGTKPDLRVKAWRRLEGIVDAIPLELRRQTGVNKKLVDKVSRSLDPIMLSYERVPWVRRKDNHPENVMVAGRGPEYQITFIDFGPSKFQIPLSCESANLIAYCPVFSREQSDELVRSMANGYNQSNEHKINPATLVLGHTNGVIQRAIDLAGAWSQPKRRSLWDQRQVLLRYAAKGIDELKDSFPEYHSRFRYEYQVIKDGLTKIADVLSRYDSNTSTWRSPGSS